VKLICIILSQFLSGSIWFAANVAYAGQGLILSAVQLGFITGSLVFALVNLSDRCAPARVFFCCSLAGAALNLCGIFLGKSPGLLMVTRFGCGISLAGIYPVGMKIAASWYPATISRALGFLVGALVLAAGFPYLIRAFSIEAGAGLILGITSGACITGGVIQVLLVRDGPHLPRATVFDMGVLGRMFRHPGFRGASFGYFGHMWELYAVFAYVPLLFASLTPVRPVLWVFGFFVAGALGCGLGGLVALKTGSRKVALWALGISGLCCFFSPWFHLLPVWASLFVMLVWGIAVVADSPQFSSLNTRFAPREYVGSALTLVNCIGFLITIITIELLGLWIEAFGIRAAFLLLLPGPVVGFLALLRCPADKPNRSNELSPTGL